MTMKTDRVKKAEEALETAAAEFSDVGELQVAARE